MVPTDPLIPKGASIKLVCMGRGNCPKRAHTVYKKYASFSYVRKTIFSMKLVGFLSIEQSNFDCKILGVNQNSKSVR